MKTSEKKYVTKSPKHSDAHFFSSNAIFPKLTIGQPGDKYEREADAMADKVAALPEKTSEPTPQVQGKCADCPDEDSLQRQPEQEEEEVQAAGETPDISKQAEEPEEEAEDGETNPSLMQKSTGKGMVASKELSSQLNSTKGKGIPLPEQKQAFFGQAFGQDFSGVRLHTDSQAVQMNKGLNAKAFNHGSDVYFNQGEYNPDSSEGKRLLGHELTHVVQQEKEKNKIQRQTGPSLPSYQPRSLPASPSICTGRQDITRLIRRLAQQIPTLITDANLRRLATLVFSSEGNFDVNRFTFVACDTINLPGLNRPGAVTEGYADESNREIGMLKKFRNDVNSFFRNQDLDSLRRVLVLIAHEKRHITITGIPQIIPSDLTSGGDISRVNYWVEEILTRSEEIAVNYRFGQYTANRYVVDLQTQQTIRFYWNQISGAVTSQKARDLRNFIHRALRTRYGSNPRVDNAISVGVLNIIDRGGWYICSGGRVYNPPQGVNIPVRNGRHIICGVSP